VAVAEFGFAVCEQTDKRPVDVAETEEAEVVGADGNLLDCIERVRCEGKMPFRQVQGRLATAGGPPALRRHCAYPITVVCSGWIL
jgi:hypothetical protein